MMIFFINLKVLRHLFVIGLSVIIKPEEKRCQKCEVMQYIQYRYIVKVLYFLLFKLSHAKELCGGVFSLYSEVNDETPCLQLRTYRAEPYNFR
jgi:hypothetical protein